MSASEDNLIDTITENRLPHYEPYGWHHWPEHPWLSYQFRRGLGETQEGGGAVSECFQAASRMIPGDKESWHREWLRVAERNLSRGLEEERLGHVRTAMNCFLRAADYFRQAEFFLLPDDPRRLATFTQMERCSHGFLRHLDPPGEMLRIPYEGGPGLYAYFVRSPHAAGRQPCLIAMGGLDSIKDEMWFMQAHGAVQRGFSVLMIDGPGQGGTLRRHGITTRLDYEVPIGRCIDYLETRDDVDPSRIAVCGSSLGGYYAARAGCYEHRLAACISHGAIWSIQDVLGEASESHGLANHWKWVFGAGSMREVYDKAAGFTLEGHLEHMRCPYLVLHGGHDVLAVSQARKVYEYGRAHGVDVTLRLLSEEETGAEHCQHDNPTIGQEVLTDWLADRLGVDQRALTRPAGRPREMSMAGAPSRPDRIARHARGRHGRSRPVPCSGVMATPAADMHQLGHEPLQPGATVRIVPSKTRPITWQAVDPRTSRVVAFGTDEQLLRAEVHRHGWIAEDTRHL